MASKTDQPVYPGGLRAIAQSTLEAIKHGSFVLDDTRHNLSPSVELSKQNTRYYSPDGLLSTWSSAAIDPLTSVSPAEVTIVETNTLEGARILATICQSNRICVLNFASAKSPGGGFLGGARAQEESIASSSTLYASLTTPITEQYYTLNKRDPKGGYYSHAMIYSPNILFFRDHSGGWQKPLGVEVLTSPAVNAKVVRNRLQESGSTDERLIETTMRERMSRILFLFEKEGARNLVLGSFGTGAFRNKVDVVARIWADLLTAPSARFKASFDHILFAILDRKTFEEFRDIFEGRSQQTTIAPVGIV